MSLLSGLTPFRKYLDTDNLSLDILRHRRGYFMLKVKRPLVDAIVALTGERTPVYDKDGSGRIVGTKGGLRRNHPISWIISGIALIRIIVHIYKYPKPTKENVKKWRTIALMDMWDEFFLYERNNSRDPIFRVMERVTLIEVEHDGFYAERITKFFMLWLKQYQSGRWKLLEPYQPSGFWTEPSVVEAQNKMRQELAEFAGIDTTHEELVKAFTDGDGDRAAELMKAGFSK